MKTQKEIEAKLKELDKMMAQNMPTKKSIDELRDSIKPSKPAEMLLKMMESSSTTISIDAQRFILQWVLYD